MSAEAEALVRQFKLEKPLNQDQAGRRISLLGSIADKPAILQLERAPFPADSSYLALLPQSLARLTNLQHNDIYAWYMALAGPPPSAPPSTPAATDTAVDFHPDLKINLIYPCTDAHIKKYSKQAVRYVVETPHIYARHIRPLMLDKRAAGRLNWVYNILAGRKEAEDVVDRTPLGAVENPEGYVLMPDLNWDRATVDALHLLCLVERRDLWSLRDLRKSHVPWLERMRAQLVQATTRRFPDVDEDQVKLYVHYQPTYYHFHIHIVHASFEPGATQAVGKAVGLDSIIETLKAMSATDEEPDPGMDRLALSYTVGEESELWERVYGPLKRGELK
ncbi:hypothetical protein TD95_005071 [Thielaviopsis punctulata]|uniref:HIT domain-containing protein n=1 Tax=Thielaviopsis punctulata TaxID=72032 RepID=A0A0F4Z9G4_9PEZI|nr:hypothetical protein TD95_005071 [Thielaviopsis punctulata]